MLLYYMVLLHDDAHVMTMAKLNQKLLTKHHHHDLPDRPPKQKNNIFFSKFESKASAVASLSISRATQHLNCNTIHSTQQTLPVHDNFDLFILCILKGKKICDVARRHEKTLSSPFVNNVD
ncbi:unnamed protein product [Amoebophrya sp. A25]|nr:unnamed protein product [Amoebophrya sp. A25]|eukprot:GSA25T00017497001.1